MILEKNEVEELEINEYLQKMRINPQTNGTGQYFKCKSGDHLYYYNWSCGKKARKIVLGIHGMASHGIFYIQVADQLIPNDVTVYALDLKHHGRSSGKKGDIDNFEELIEQIGEFILFLKEKNGSIPIFLMGMSLGCTVAINYSVLFPDVIKGLILMAPPVKTMLHLTLKDFLESPYYLLTYIFFRGNPVIDLTKRHSLCSRNPWRIKYDEIDELHLKKISLRYLLQGNEWDKKAHDNVSRISCPVLILQGTADHTVSYEGVEEFYNKISYHDKKLVELKGAYHCLFSDPAMMEQGGWDEIKKWLASH